MEAGSTVNPREREFSSRPESLSPAGVPEAQVSFLESKQEGPESVRDQGPGISYFILVCIIDFLINTVYFLISFGMFLDPKMGFNP